MSKVIRTGNSVKRKSKNNKSDNERVEQSSCSFYPSIKDENFEKKLLEKKEFNELILNESDKSVKEL